MAGGEPKPAKTVAGRVIREATFEAGADIGDAKDVDEKRRQLVGPLGQRLGPVGVVGIVGEQVRRLVDHHVTAGPGWNHHRRLALAKHVDHVSRHGARVIPAAGVESRLAAAGLPLWHVHLDPRPFEHPDDRKPDLRREAVDQAGDHQLYGSRMAFRMLLLPEGAKHRTQLLLLGLLRQDILPDGQ